MPSVQKFPAQRLWIGLALFVSLLLASCGRDAVQWDTRDITGVMPDLKFTLADSHGKTVHADHYLGKINLLYFGYTHCPDVCPLTLATITQALDEMGDAADRITVLFVSVDPSRDTPSVLQDYAAAFGSSIVGLTGTQAQLQALSKRYRVSYRYGAADADGNYAVYHSAGIFVFDGKGRARLLMNRNDGAQTVSHDLKALLRHD